MTFLAELKRRNVFRVGVFYVVTAWLVIQVAETLMPAFGVPDVALRTVVFLLVVGFFPAVVFAWLYELTPDGIKRESQVDRNQSITHQTARRMDLFTIAVVVLGVGFVIAERMMDRSPESPAGQAADLLAQPAGSTPEIKTIAVLPFVNMSAEDENEFFSDGISEELLNVLVKIQGLQVASRTSAFSFKGKDVDIPTVASALGVDHVVEGSVRRAGDQVRITAQLIAVDSDSHLWSETYTRQLDDVFAIQDEIARAIADALSVELLGAQGQRIETHDTDNLAAFEAYLLGRHYFHQRTGESLRKAIELFEQAVAADPEYAEAYSGLADAYMLIFQYSDYPFDPAVENAVRYAERATELDPLLGEAWASRGLAKLIVDPNATAEMEALFDKAITLSPGYSMAYMWYGNYMHNTGRINDAYQLFRRAESIDPLHPVIAENIGDTLLSMGRFEEARAHLQAALVRDPDNLILRVRLANAFWNVADLVQAHRILRETAELDPSSPLALEDLIFLELDLGRAETTRHLAEQFRQRFPDYDRPINIAQVGLLFASGQLQPALAHVEAMRSRMPAPFRVFANLIEARLRLHMEGPEKALEDLEGIKVDRVPGPDAQIFLICDRALALALVGQSERAREEAELGLEMTLKKRDSGDQSHETLLLQSAFLALLDRSEEGLSIIRQAFDNGARFVGVTSPRPNLDRLYRSVPGYAEIAQAVDADLRRQRQLIEAELDGA